MPHAFTPTETRRRPARRMLAAALLAAATAALPGSAYAAGSSTGSGQAALTVGAECAVTGGNVDLGTFTTDQTWGDVDATLGYVASDGTTYHPGLRGVAYADFGSVTCDKDVDYTLTISGEAFRTLAGGVRVVINGTAAEMFIAIKEVGGNVLADDNGNRSFSAPNAGQVLGTRTDNSIAAKGTGSEQRVKGSLIRYDALGVARQNDVLGEVGSFSGKIDYTLYF
ncbi:MAG: hypothetical protein RLZZ427_927 [Pseudomonadota bacterium]|jgi:hypothetical protein